MFLYVVTLGKSEQDVKGTVNLPFLIDEIRGDLETDSPSNFERFNNLIYQTGYIDSEGYKQFSYIPVSEKMFSVVTGFPRICPDELPLGIERLSYDIKLLDCEPFSDSPDWMELS